MAMKPSLLQKLKYYMGMQEMQRPRPWSKASEPNPLPEYVTRERYTVNRNGDKRTVTVDKVGTNINQK